MFIYFDSSFIRFCIVFKELDGFVGKCLAHWLKETVKQGIVVQ